MSSYSSSSPYSSSKFNHNLNNKRYENNSNNNNNETITNNNNPDYNISNISKNNTYVPLDHQRLLNILDNTDIIPTERMFLVRQAITTMKERDGIYERVKDNYSFFSKIFNDDGSSIIDKSNKKEKSNIMRCLNFTCFTPIACCHAFRFFIKVIISFSMLMFLITLFGFMFRNIFY